MRHRFPVLFLALILGLCLAVAGCGGDDDGGTDTDVVAEKTELLAGIPQEGAVLGEADAPVKITEYLDLQCPFCQRASEELLPDLLTEFVQPGTASIEGRPIVQIGPASGDGALGAYAAAEQDKMWEFLEVTFTKQEGEESGWLDRDLMEGIATDIGLDVDKWAEDYDSDAAASWVAGGLTQAANDEAQGVPHFVIEGPEGREVVPGLGSIDQFREAIGNVS